MEPKFKLKIENKKNDRNLFLSGESIDELIEKIIEWQTMGSFEKSRFEKKGTLEEELKSGWWCLKETYAGNNQSSKIEILDEELEQELVGFLYGFEYEEIPNSALYKFDYDACAKALTQRFKEILKINNEQQDTFAIEFAEWYENDVLAKGDYEMIAKDKKELLEIFKETYGKQ